MATPSAAPSAAPAANAPPGAGYDPVALAESLASAAEKSAKLIGEFAQRQAASGHTLMSDELGIGKAFLELAAQMMARVAKIAISSAEGSRRCMRSPNLRNRNNVEHAQPDERARSIYRQTA